MKVQIQVFLFGILSLRYLLLLSKNPSYIISIVDICDIFHVFVEEQEVGVGGRYVG
jgi:hypothetical protein